MSLVQPASWSTRFAAPTAPPAAPVYNPPVATHPTPNPPVPTIIKTLPKKPAPAPKPKPKPQPQSALQKWLAGDTTYQDQLSEFNKSKSDYNTTYNTQVQQADRDYAETQRELNLQGQKDRMAQQNDFAGRGILHSGVFAQALSDYNNDFNTKSNNLLTGKTDKLGDLSTQRNSFLQELQLQLNAAKQDAIRRRAESLGL